MKQTDKVKISVRLDKMKLEKLEEMYETSKISDIINRMADEVLTIGMKRSTKKLSVPILRIGGKVKIADEIVSIMPEHKTFVDVFGGSGAILLAKPKNISKLEIFNDKLGDIAVLFEIIQKRPLELRDLIMSYPCSRAFYSAMKRKRGITDPLEQAARFFYISRYSYYGDGRSGWNTALHRDTQKTANRILNEILLLSGRLKGVRIESMDWADILRKYQSEETLFYTDSPYIMPNKKKGIYERKFTQRDNYELQQRIYQTKGLFMVSHSENKLFDKWFESWNKYQIHTKKTSAKAENGEKPRVIENVYCNFVIPK